MQEKIFRKIDEIAPQMIESIIELVRIESVKAQGSKEAPFGEGVKRALEKALEISASLGFQTNNMDHYIGYASYGEGSDYICAAGHLDVVEAGRGWKYLPFGGVTENGMIYGRGVLDNKGPIMACLYALYALKELEIPLKHEIRILFGCDEESGFEDMRYYLSREKPPAAGFTPDCKYPVVYGERGRLVTEIRTDSTKQFCELMNGYVLNAGRGGETFGIAAEHPEFGKLEIRKTELVQDRPPALRLSVSYPFGITSEEIIEKIREKIPDMSVEPILDFPPVRFERDSSLVRTLQRAYETVTGEDGTPVTTTGGTYSKILPNIVPFGPSFPGQKGIGHLPDEWMKIEDIIINAKIYALSLYLLAKEEEGR